MKLFRRYTKRMEDRAKVEAKIAELNETFKPGTWADVGGFSAITGFEYPSFGKNASFLAGTGLPVKVFVNNDTGEVKIFAAILFKKSSNG